VTVQDPLFALTGDDVALTTDEWYTPRWIFAAAALTFDLDVAAPVSPVLRTCPALHHLTAADDGLTSPWSGVVWMNPPYSKAAPWVDRWAAHPDGLALLPALPEVTWSGVLLSAAHTVCLLGVTFGRPDGSQARLRWPCLLVGRGSAAPAVARVAAADPYRRGAYHVHPDWTGPR
jgi:hypothetical protein